MQHDHGLGEGKGGGGGGGLRSNICNNVAAFMIPFNLICNITLF